VLVPGEREATLRVERLVSGVPLDAETWRQIASAGTALGVPPPPNVHWRG